MDIVNAIAKARFSSAAAQRVRLHKGQNTSVDLICMESGQEIQGKPGQWLYYVITGTATLTCSQTSSQMPAGQLGEIGELLPTKGLTGCMGTEGTLQYGQNVGPTGVLLDGRPVPNDDTNVNQFDTMLEEFHDAITQDREPETSAVRCRVVIEMIEAILRSCRTHEVVPIAGTGAVTY